ncbi:hypothetical protein T484DRAFT_1923784 [Baffinella frigidus]|nr:hypothetical protein T484DRAFT_1923784 [Cryptophyta sp. CCMP2293]
MMDVLEFLDSCVDGGEGGRVVSLRAMVLCVGVQADWMGAPTKDSTPALLYCLRCLDARDSFSKGRDPAGRVTGHVDVFLDTTVTLVPPGVVAGATVSIRRIRPRIGAKGNVSAIAGKDTLIAVEVPVELGWKPPRVTSVPFGGQGGAAGAWRVGRSARLGDVDPIAKEHGLLELRASITSLRHVSLQSRCRFCLCTRTIRPGALQPRAPLCNALSAARGVAAGGAAECQLELYARAECLVDDSTGRAWLLVEGVDMVLGALLGANAETTAALITCACAYGRVEFQQGVTADTLVLSREVEARREAELEAYRRLAVQVESASQGGSLTSLRILAEHRPQAAPPGPGRVAPHKIGEARVGLVSTLKRRRTVDRAVPRLRCWSIVREDAEKEVQLLLARIKGRLEGRDAGT